MAFLESAVGAVEDISEGVRLAPMWWRLGLEQTIARYRRTLLGPFWLSSSTVATGIAISIVFGSLFGGDWRQNFAFILSGVMCFNLISGLVSDGSQTYLNASGTMQVRKLPLSFHSFLMCDKAIINFAHQLVAFWFVTAIFRVVALPHWEILLTFPLVLAICFFLSFPIGMISTRFRDIHYFVGFILTTAFMITPVFWRRAQIPPHLSWIVDYNPLAHMLEILRQPFMGHPAPATDLEASVLLLGVAFALAAISLTYFRRRVVFWL